jgi:hypothetical protein
MKYVLLFCGSPQDAARWEAMSEEARSQAYEKVGQWFGQHRDKIRGTQELQPANMATSIHFDGNGKPLVTDGPYLEGTEVIGGYAEIEVADLDEALSLAKTWPGGGVEIRPTIPH